MTTPIPDSAHVGEAVAHVRDVLHPQIFNHSVRTFLLGRQAAMRDGVTDLDSESLCLAALFHDSGTAVGYDGPARFEVEGADAAARFLQQRGWSAAVVDPIWEAIALHTTPGIPERRGPIAHYLRRGVEIEFGPAELRASFEDGVVARSAIPAHRPRGDPADPGRRAGPQAAAEGHGTVPGGRPGPEPSAGAQGSEPSFLT
jgi:HD domain